MSKVSKLEELLDKLLKEAQNLLAALVVDLDGLIIARSSVKGFDEELIGAIMAILDQTINKIKRYAETSFGSGTFDTNDFQLFYMELGNKVPAIFVLVADHSNNIDKFIPYSYIVAEKISSILSNHDTPLQIPKLDNEGELILPAEEYNKNNVRKITLVGSEAVGKTKLARMYCGANFKENGVYKPTIGIAILEKELQILKDYNLKLYIFDLGGARSFAKIRRFYYEYSDAVLILFDYSQSDNIAKIPDWIEELQHSLRNRAIPHILVGNKIDLAENLEDINMKAQNLADHYNIPFFETSAFTGEGIDELFTYLISNLF